MKITKNSDHYLFQNEDGEYHLSIEKYNELGPDKAEEFALQEIKLKNNSNLSENSINFKQARNLGFCEFGIKDFANKLNLDIEGEYSLDFLNKKLTLDILKIYPRECTKLFGKNTLNHLGGILGILSEDTLNLVLSNNFIPEKTLHKLACEFALNTLSNFEKKYPEDKRPRLAIEAKIKWLDNLITDDELKAAYEAADAAASEAAHSAAYSAAYSALSAAYSALSAARSAASSAAYLAALSTSRSAAHSAAYSASRSVAYSAAYSASRSAAYSALSASRSVAYSAAYSASRSAASEAERKKQVNIIIKVLNENN